MESKQRRRFSREFKVEAVRLANQEGVLRCRRSPAISVSGAWDRSIRPPTPN